MRKYIVLSIILLACYSFSVSAADHLKIKNVQVSSQLGNYAPQKAIDGLVADNSRWVSEKEDTSWIELQFEQAHRIGGIHIYSGYGEGDAIEDFKVQYLKDNQWKDIPSAIFYKNKETAISKQFDDTEEITTTSIRLLITKSHERAARIKEVVVWPYMTAGIPKLGEGVTGWEYRMKDADIPQIYLNQSGFNLGQPKRFTAPTLQDGTAFKVTKANENVALFEGVIKNHIGDFSAFNPKEVGIEYVIRAADKVSFPFGIGHWWLERVTYQNMINFMVDSRHYGGTYTKKCRGSYGWRDDHHFGWELHTLIPQFLSNPEAYLRMPSQMSYQQPFDKKLWGDLEPYDETVPDIVKLIHWGTDVIVTQQLKHEHLKAQLAYFLYAWPWLKEWLPEQNYEKTKAYAFKVWADVEADRKYPYDQSKGHNMLALKTRIGTTKGALPPGYTVMPNLMMYEVAKRENRDDNERYFKAAFDQVQWMIDELDWNDPLNTKGQRMSEHLTMTGLSFMYTQYGDSAPEGLKEKIEEWAQVMLRRSNNLWDFRKLDDGDNWAPTGPKVTMWNEPGNVLGFPACAMAAMKAIDAEDVRERLNTLIYAHFDNAFGRNPTGRHTVYHAARDIEGAEIGWYSLYKGGVGQLQDARFVLEGTAKNDHYPYHPEVGNVSWSEGWVTFNTAFNLSMAYLADQNTEISAERKGKKYEIKLKVPLNFDYQRKERVQVIVTDKKGNQVEVALTEMTEDSPYFVGEVSTKIKPKSVSYGHGYFEHKVEL
ncbi:hypothetical protein EYV94_08350 [Puteibacter caeruleilacunae]|nr:hypothetical protein EYV94_08350 [Puteibacter caeruleilacunae]